MRRRSSSPAPSATTDLLRRSNHELSGQARPQKHGVEKAGAEWGQVLHTMLEAAMKQPKLDLHRLAMSTLASEDLPVTLVDEVVATVQRVIASDLWRRAQNATQCLTEVPLATLIHSGSGLPTVQRGVIDLAFQEPTGWVIIDYKSERVESHDIPALVAYYQPQIEAYGSVWETVVGQTVVERGLYFTDSAEYHSI